MLAYIPAAVRHKMARVGCLVAAEQEALPAIRAVAAAAWGVAALVARKVFLVLTVVLVRAVAERDFFAARQQTLPAGAAVPATLRLCL